MYKRGDDSRELSRWELFGVIAFPFLYLLAFPFASLMVEYFEKNLPSARPIERQEKILRDNRLEKALEEDYQLPSCSTTTRKPFK